MLCLSGQDVAHPILYQIRSTPVSKENIVGALQQTNIEVVLGRPFVKRFALCYRSVVCLSVLSAVTFVHWDQTVGRIKMKLATQIGFGPGHTVLDGDPAPPHPKGHTPNFRPISVAAKWLHGLRCHLVWSCLLYTSPSPRDRQKSRMPSSA